MEFSMKFSFFISFFFTLGAMGTDETQKRFKIVSEYTVAREFYPEIRARKPESLEVLMEFKEKKIICKDIISSHYIQRRLAYNLNYPIRRKASSRDEELLDRSPRKYAKVTLGPEKEQDEDFHEWVFVCPVRKRHRRRGEKFYISEEYKVGGDIDSTDNYVAGRFIFRFYARRIRLDGLAEAAPKIENEASEEIENVYIERRMNHEPASELIHDPLCASKHWEKVRICTAIFNSDYFFREIDYPQTNWVDGSCKKRIVSFQKVDLGEASSAKQYEEWMMTCDPFDDDKPHRLTFLLSQAYKANEIFVYAVHRNQKTFYLEGRAVNIRFTV